MKTLFVIFLCFFKQASSKLTEPSGKYCGEIISNPIDIIFNMNLHLANISASIFQKDYECDSENYEYNYSDFSIQLPNDKDDCLNQVLEKYNLCPCPPQSFYNVNENSVSILNDIIGVIELKKC